MKSLLSIAALMLLSVSALAQNVIPAITDHPDNASVNAGAQVTFTASGTGTPTPTVQWQVSGPNDGGVFTNIGGGSTSTNAGVTTSSLTFATAASQDGNQYRAVYTNSEGSVNTNAATLTVLVLPNITVQPANQTVAVNGTATFTANTDNANDTVQWQFSSNGGVSFQNVVGGTSRTLTISNVISGQNGYRFRAVFTNADGSIATNAAILTVTNSTTPPVTPPTTPPTTPTPGTGTNGVLVYELNFKHKEGFNMDFWDGGYVIVPATGGEGSALFTATDGGRRTFRSFSSSVNFYNAKDKHHNYSVMSMAGTSPSVVCITAYGRADDKVKANGPTYTITVRAADTMEGWAQASRDENALPVDQQPRDGTVGFLEFAEVKAVLDETLTDQANENASSVSSMFDFLKAVLTRRGFAEEAASDDDGDDGDDGGVDDGTDDDTTTTTN